LARLQLLLGERTDKSLIRNGADSCTVEAIFDWETTAKAHPRLSRPESNHARTTHYQTKFLGSAGTRQFINGSPRHCRLEKSRRRSVDLHGPTITILAFAEKQLSLLDFVRAPLKSTRRISKEFSAITDTACRTCRAQHRKNRARTGTRSASPQIDEITCGHLVAGEEKI